MFVEKRRLTCLIAVSIASLGLLPAVAENREPAVSAAAEKARAKYVSAVEKSQEKYSDEVSAHFSDYLKELETIQDKETKAGRLEVAVAVRDEIKRLQTEGAPVFAEAPPTSLRTAIPRLVGTWSTLATTGAKRIYIVDSSGKVKFVDEKLEGQLKSRGKEITLDFGDNKIERWSYCDGRIFIEHWYPKDTYPMGPPINMAIGQKVGR
jgi:hypothetical protein